MIKLTLTLADGTQFSEVVHAVPKFWKSRLMAQTPYATDFQGSVFSFQPIEKSK